MHNIIQLSWYRDRKTSIFPVPDIIFFDFYLPTFILIGTTVIRPDIEAGFACLPYSKVK